MGPLVRKCSLEIWNFGDEYDEKRDRKNKTNNKQTNKNEWMKTKSIALKFIKSNSTLNVSIPVQVQVQQPDNYLVCSLVHKYFINLVCKYLKNMLYVVMILFGASVCSVCEKV